MKRISSCLCFASSFVLASVWIGCGSSDSGGGTTGTDSGTHGDTSTTTDSGVHPDSSTDGGTDTGGGDTTKTDGTTDAPKDAPGETTTDAPADSPTETSADASDATDASDAGSSATGTKLVDGTSLVLLGVTNDEFVIFADTSGSAPVLKDVAVAGGTAATIDAAATNAFIAGSDVFSWAADATTFVGPIAVWTSAGGEKPLGTKSVAIRGGANALTDGSYVAYLDNAATDGTSADVVVAKGDTTGKATAFTGVSTDGSCALGILPLGAKFVVAHCAAGASTVSIDVVANDGTSVNVSGDAGGVPIVDAAGTKIFFVNPAGDGVLYDVATAVSTTVESADVSNGWLSSDGATLAFLATDGKLKKTSTATVSVSLLVDLGTTGAVYGFSPTLGAGLYSTTDDSAGAGLGLKDVSSVEVATATTHALFTPTTAASGGGFGESFTTDATRALFFDVTDTTNFVGSLESAPIAGGTPVVVSTDNVWSVLASTGTKIAFTANWVADPAAATSGTADLRAADSTSTTSTLLATQIQVDGFLMSHARDKVVYLTTTFSTPGIYAVTVP